MPKTQVLRAARRRLTQPQEDYIKALYELRRPGQGVATSELANRLGVSGAATTEMLDRLRSLDLATHDRYRGAGLTAAGEAIALEMLRHHRLIETWLVESLGYTWDEVHEEAEHLEHVISERMEERIFAALGRPELDPHGDPIPSAAGTLKMAAQRSLLECRAGDRVEVRRVSDRDPEKLRALQKLGLSLGEVVMVEAESRWDGPIRVRSGGRRLQLPIGLAAAVFVEAAGNG